MCLLLFRGVNKLKTAEHDVEAFDISTLTVFLIRTKQNIKRVYCLKMTLLRRRRSRKRKEKNRKYYKYTMTAYDESEDVINEEVRKPVVCFEESEN